MRHSHLRMTYEQADKRLGSRSRINVPGGLRGTVLQRVEDGIAVVYWGTAVVTIHQDDTYTLRTNGFHTVTTKSRINSFSPAGVYQKNYIWYCDGQEFYEGMRVDANGNDVTFRQHLEKALEHEMCKRGKGAGAQSRYLSV